MSDTKITDDEATALFASYIHQVIDKANKAQALEESVKALKETITWQNERAKEAKQKIIDLETEQTRTIKNAQVEIDRLLQQRNALTKEVSARDSSIAELLKGPLLLQRDAARASEEKIRAEYTSELKKLNDAKDELLSENKRLKYEKTCAIEALKRHQDTVVALREDLRVKDDQLKAKQVEHDDEIEKKDDWMKAVAYEWNLAIKDLEARVDALELQAS